MPPPRTPPQAQAEWTGADVRVGKSEAFWWSNAFTGQKEARDADELSEGGSGDGGSEKGQWYEPFFVCFSLT